MDYLQLAKRKTTMSSVTLLQEYRATENPPLIIERFLRDREGVWQQIKQEYCLNALIGQMLRSSTIALVGYGAVMGAGASNPLLQAGASALKLPILYLLTLAICLPTLYLFNLLCGGRLSARQALALALAAITVSSALTLAFAPISIFFLITAKSYPFYQLLNVSILTLTGVVGLQFLVSGVHSMNRFEPAEHPQPEAGELHASSDAEPRPAPNPFAYRRSVNLTLLYFWLMLYGFVGTQLSWTLRPFFGDPDKPFVLFRAIDGNFSLGVIEAFVRLFQ
jgi:hypothetical protein